MRKHIVALGLGLMLTNAASAAIILVQYTAPAGSFSPTTEDANVSASALNVTGSTAQIEAGSVSDTFFYVPGTL
jgi:hypothetical protein